MASKVDWSTLEGYKKSATIINEQRSPNADFTVTIEASCPTGFEAALLKEINEKHPSSITVKHQGRIFFDIPVSNIRDVLDLKCVDNAYVIIGKRTDFDFSGDIDTCLSKINDLLNIEQYDPQNLPLAWDKGIIAWNEVFQFKENGENSWAESLSLLNDNQSLVNPTEDDVKKPKYQDLPDNDTPESNAPTRPKFRVTCYRSGQECHSFQSMDVARSFGGAINDKFGWGVSMKEFDIEVVITIDLQQIYVGLGLTKKSLFQRNIKYFGPTTLRATICASMLQLADIQPGDIVVDPMCGGGSIPIEGALSFQKGFQICGDNHEKAIYRATENFKALSESLTELSGSKICKNLPADVMSWDVTRIPLRDNSVDVFVTDLPFGKRSGSKADNRVLYPKIMSSMARVVKANTGRAVLLTQDKNSMFKSYGKFSKFWKINRQYYCNIGGLKSLVYIMRRTQLVP